MNKTPLNEAPKRFKKDTLSMNIHSLYEMHQSGNFHFEANYQRGYVWSDEQKEFLISSVVEWIPINAIYWNEYNETDPLEIVDGKQRLSTIFQYLDDQFTWKGYLYSELPRPYQGIIKSFTVSIYKSSFQTEEACEELYRRINFTGTPHIL